MASRICLISMPFTPVTTPGLGISMLKAAAERIGVNCDIYYGSLDFFRYVNPEVDPTLALFDYNFIASNQQLGDLLFAPQLWGNSTADVNAALDELAAHRNYMFSSDELRTVVQRIRTCSSRLPEFITHCLNSRDWSQYALVGLSSTFSQNIASLVFARELKKRYPNLHIIFGGANCDGEMGRALLESFSFVDGVLQGECENSFPDYISRFLNKEDYFDIPGALVRHGADIISCHPAVPIKEMDSLPFPDFHDYYEQLPDVLKHPYNRHELSLPVETSRGCWWGAVHHCVFCGLNPTTMVFREKTPERALSEILRLRDKYGERRITAVDNIISTRYFESVLPKLEGEGLDLFYETKANLSESQVQRLARAGVRTIQPGIEGLNSNVLRLMDKGVHGHQNLELLKWCSVYNLQPIWFYLYRFPNEPIDAYFQDIIRIPHWFHLPPPRNPNPVVIDRYSPLYSSRDKFGIHNLRPGGYTDLCYRGLPKADRMRISYHFEADLPQGNDLPYEIGLWEVITRWNRAYGAGARLYQFCAPNSTLILDTRRENAAAYLLTDEAHRVYHALRTGRGFSALTRELIQIEKSAADPQPEDFELVYAANSFNAITLEKEPGTETLLPFLQHMESYWLVEHIDDRWLALATDCTDPLAAERLGLDKFARSLDYIHPLSPSIQLADPELIQILKAEFHAS